MKVIWTYGYKRRPLPPDQMVRVNIARGPCRWVPVHCHERSLAPSAETFRAADWRPRYLAQIQALHASGDLRRIVARLPEGCVLFCWEADWNDCHRKVLWDFLHEHYGVAGGELSLVAVAGLLDKSDKPDKLSGESRS